jgi:ribosome biogenesis GTPase
VLDEPLAGTLPGPAGGFALEGDHPLSDASHPTVQGVVCAAGGGVYEVRLDEGRMVEAALRGRLKLEARTGDRVVAGDHVTLTRWHDAWVVESVGTRQTAIVRRGRSGRRAKVVAANLDRAVVVVATRDPVASRQLIDRLLVVAEASGMHPLLVVNKADLDGGRRVVDELTTLYGGIGYPVLVTSTVTGEGIADLRTELCRGAAALVGPSGVGKSSLLNAVDPSLSLRTGDLSGRNRRGRHTTVSVRLVALACGGLVADTPGFGDVGLWEVAPEDVEHCFPELAALVKECRFVGCAHLKDAGCAVRAAVERGDVAESRYHSYAALREETERVSLP